MDQLDLLAVQGTLKSFLQHHNSKASILQCSAFFIVQLSHPYVTTGKTIALTRWTFVGKVMSLLFNMLSRLVITFILFQYFTILITTTVVSFQIGRCTSTLFCSFRLFQLLWIPCIIISILRSACHFCTKPAGTVYGDYTKHTD